MRLGGIRCNVLLKSQKIGMTEAKTVVQNIAEGRHFDKHSVAAAVTLMTPEGIQKQAASGSSGSSGQ